MITQERLKKLLRYSPIVGVFEWRVAGRRIRPGFLAGGKISNGYIVVTIEKKRYPAHQLAWLYMTGSWPDGIIDHIDGDKSNNAFSNLRVCTAAQNVANSKRKATNTSGVKGVCLDRGKWRARLLRGGKAVFDKHYATKEEASAAIMEARERIDGEFANHGVHKFEAEDLDAA